MSDEVTDYTLMMQDRHALPTETPRSLKKSTDNGKYTTRAFCTRQPDLPPACRR